MAFADFGDEVDPINHLTTSTFRLFKWLVFTERVRVNGLSRTWKYLSSWVIKCVWISHSVNFDSINKLAITIL